MRQLLFIVGLAGCGGLELDVTFDIPDEYQSMVESVTLRVLSAPAGDPFACDDLAFSAVESKTIVQSTIATYTLDGRTPLGELDRRSQKLFLAQALGSDGLPVVSGCTNVGVLDASNSVTIEGEPAPIAALGVPPDGDRQTFQGLDVVCRDIFGGPLAGIPYRWVVVGASPDADPVLDEGEGTTVGTVTELVVPEPAFAGPATLALSVRWQRSWIRPLSILAVPEQRWIRVFAHEASTSLVTGRLGPAGATEIATLNTNTASEMWIHRYIHDPGAKDPAFPFATPPPTIVPATSGALLAVERNDFDALVVIANEPAGSVAWFDFPPTAAPIHRELSPASIAVAAADLPACDAGANVLVRLLDANPTRVYDVDGLSVAHPFEQFRDVSAITATGCLLHESLRLQAIALTDGPANLLVVATESQAFTTAFPPGAVPVAFSPPGAPEQLAFVPETTADSQLLERREVLALAAEGPNHNLILGLVGEDTLGGTPVALATGDMDADGNTDVAALVIGRAPPDAAVGTKLLIILGKQPRLTAWSQSLTFVSPTMVVGDVDNNGFDDIVLAESEPGESARLEIFAMGPL